MAPEYGSRSLLDQDCYGEAAFLINVYETLHLIFANTFPSLKQGRYVERLPHFVVVSVVVSQWLGR